MDNFNLIMKQPPELPTPSVEQVEQYLRQWDNDAKESSNEKALNRLFRETYPKNTDIGEIIIKASALNDLYGTYVLSLYEMCRHISRLDIDNRLEKGDLTLIKDISCLTISEKTMKFYSFATKYCSHHKPDIFPIYDYYVERVLWHFKKKDNFADFKREELKDYPTFVSVIESFKRFYCLEQYTLKQIDKYLWQLGKEYFKREYKSKLQK